MAEIVELQKQKRRLAAKRGFKVWNQRFPEHFNEDTRLMDLSDSTLNILAKSGEESSLLLYDLIMGLKGYGRGARFFELPSKERLTVTDITLFLLDQLRFEAMRRLGWVEEVPTSSVVLLDLVDRFSTTFAPLRNTTPALSPSHPRYPEYKDTFCSDQHVFVRKLIPEALEAFEARLANTTR